MSEYIIDMTNSSYKSESGLLCADVSQLREEIVRCRDCKHYTGKKITCGAIVLGYDCSLLSAVVEPDGFCSWGERRTDDN